VAQGKTQVYLAKIDDHIQNRLTHTMEVIQISQELCQDLGLNIDLAAAAAHGHDLGHSPFGHVGERTLHDIAVNGVELSRCAHSKGLLIQFAPENMGFQHAYQTLRIVQDLEPAHSLFPFDTSDDGIKSVRGMNLTKQVQWAVAVHTQPEKWPFRNPETGENLLRIYDKNLESVKNAFSAEAFVVAVADEIAQIHHDIMDSYILSFSKPEDIRDQIVVFLDAIQCGCSYFEKEAVESEILQWEIKWFRDKFEIINGKTGSGERNPVKRRTKNTFLFSGRLLRVLRKIACIIVKKILDDLRTAWKCWG
jgi:dGTPase